MDRFWYDLLLASENVSLTLLLLYVMRTNRIQMQRLHAEHLRINAIVALLLVNSDPSETEYLLKLLDILEDIEHGNI